MTRRERKERRIDRRLDWAASRDRDATARFGAASALADQIPLGQPILVGHHSERHARRDADRIASSMTRGVESQRMAAHHRAVAGGIADQLDRSVFSDDPGAIERLKARIAERTAQLERRKSINREIRKGTGWPARIQPGLTREERRELEDAARFSGSVGYPAYAIRNLSALIRRDRDRLEQLRASAEQVPA